METEVRVEGIKELRAGLRRAGGPDLEDGIKTANKNAAERVVRSALPHVPVGRPPDKHPGRLKASVKALASKSSGRVKAGSAARVPYAAAIHWGEGAGNINHTTGATVGRPERNIQGRPFLWEAADREMRGIVEAYDQEVTDLLDRAVRDR